MTSRRSIKAATHLRTPLRSPTNSVDGRGRLPLEIAADAADRDFVEIPRVVPSTDAIDAAGVGRQFGVGDLARKTSPVFVDRRHFRFRVDQISEFVVAIGFFAIGFFVICFVVAPPSAPVPWCGFGAVTRFLDLDQCECGFAFGELRSAAKRVASDGVFTL